MSIKVWAYICLADGFVVFVCAYVDGQVTEQVGHALIHVLRDVHTHLCVLGKEVGVG